MTNAQSKFYEKIFAKYDSSTRWAYQDFCRAKQEYNIYKAKGWIPFHAMPAKKKAIEAYYRFKFNRFDCLAEENLFKKYGNIYSDLQMMKLQDFAEMKGL